jgi:hypothetical protein
MVDRCTRASGLTSTCSGGIEAVGQRPDDTYINPDGWQHAATNQRKDRCCRPGIFLQPFRQGRKVRLRLYNRQWKTNQVTTGKTLFPEIFFAYLPLLPLILNSQNIYFPARPVVGHDTRSRRRAVDAERLARCALHLRGRVGQFQAG